MPAYFEKHFDWDYLDFFPIADLHDGSPQCDEKMVEHLVLFIKRNEWARWIGLGDWTNNNIVGSAGTPYEDLYPPKKQIERVTELFHPIKNQGWGIVAGNHNHRIRRAVGIDPDEIIARNLELTTWGDSCFLDIILKHKKWSIYTHHGEGGGYTVGGKVNAVDRLNKIGPIVDFIIAAHGHTTQLNSTAYVMVGKGNPHRKSPLYIRGRRQIQVGCFLDWDGSYAETKGRPPVLKEIMWLRLRGVDGGRQTEKIGLEMFEPHIFSS